jgi:erythromycin esterase-like protein
MHSKLGRLKSCEESVLLMLRDLLAKRLEYSASRNDGEEFHSTEQNAHVVADAEEYYGELPFSSASSWSMRDTHMYETLERLLNSKPPRSKAVV